MTENGLLEQFIEMAEDSAATVERAECTPEAVARAVLDAAGNSRGILLAESDFLPSGLFVLLKDDQRVITSPGEDQLATAEVGVSGAFAAVARTGSVCVRISAGLEYSVGLFTRHHIVLLGAGSVVARPRDVFEMSHQKEISATEDFVFITGPSATADMGSLVRGVHGPGSLHIIVLDC